MGLWALDSWIKLFIMLPLHTSKVKLQIFVFFLSFTVLTSMSEREFIEGRRRALIRFINLVARHPLFSEDELVKTFLTYSGSVCFQAFSCTISTTFTAHGSIAHPVWFTLCPFPLTHSSPCFANRMSRLSCVTLARKRVTSLWPTGLQPKLRFVMDMVTPGILFSTAFTFI